MSYIKICYRVQAYILRYLEVRTVNIKVNASEEGIHYNNSMYKDQRYDRQGFQNEWPKYASACPGGLGQKCLDNPQQVVNNTCKYKQFMTK